MRRVKAGKFLVAVLMVLLCLSSCENVKGKGHIDADSKDKSCDGVALSVVQSDVEETYWYTSMYVETESFEVIKRQTNIENKEDIVYVTIKGNNEYYEITQHYKLRYLLYNEGWILEELQEYSDAEHGNSITPLKEYITDKHIYEFLQGYNVAAKDSKIKGEHSAAFEAINWEFAGIEKIAADLRENYGQIVYHCKVIYEYYCFTETANVPIVCDFSTSDGSWGIAIDEERITRSTVLNQGIIGKWHYESRSFFYGDYSITADITSYNGVSCTVDFYTEKGYRYSGEMMLVSNYDEWYFSDAHAYMLEWPDNHLEIKSDHNIIFQDSAGMNKWLEKQ